MKQVSGEDLEIHRGQSLEVIGRHVQFLSGLILIVTNIMRNLIPSGAKASTFTLELNGLQQVIDTNCL